MPCITGEGATLAWVASELPNGSSDTGTTVTSVISGLEIQSMAPVSLTQEVFDAPHTGLARGAFMPKCFGAVINHSSFDATCYHQAAHDYSNIMGAEGTLTRLVGGRAGTAASTQKLDDEARIVGAELVGQTEAEALTMSNLTFQFVEPDGTTWKAS